MSDSCPATRERIKVSYRLERLPSSSYHVFLTFLLIVAWFIESIDLGGMGYLLPVLGQHFNLPPSMMGLVASISFAGMFVGSIFSGSLSDKFGRKKILMAAMAFWGTAGALLSIAWSVESLLAFRFLLGVGLGAQVPIGITMLSELVPSQSRGKYLSFYQAFLPLGIAAAGLTTYVLLPKFGWQVVFLAEALPALWFLVIWKYLPESARWLESKGRYREADEVAREMEEQVEKSIGRTLPPIEDLVRSLGEGEKESAAGKEVRQGLSELLSRHYLTRLVMSGVLMFTTMAAYYGLSMWLSALLVAKGFSVTKSIGFVSLIALGGIPAYLLVTYLVETAGRKWASVITIVAMAVSAYAYGSAATVVLVIVLGLIYQFFQFGMTMVNNVYIPELWPTPLRGTGTGFAFGIGRVGAFLGPMVLGIVMGAYGPHAVFMCSSGLLLFGAFVVLVLGPETKGQIF
ncbi:arabinose efflux permease family protein [Desulfosporosinus orientis DSM 765]|uniref:Arabinose efflux permease family protein n=1 Tax=Desulfosporosinus orientis (strain ATCC 19365 / DSM 765 / NCIMB 8382 / VKM B-1628 / Singapore I) TaxID=768706 RepID=G7W615_DESOD|nr:MFS transporter [Desulfosporosinus orientis]AET67391.1 arabinose efflux permease family protein [Desulfosporosinus orientis DSM 765]